MTHNPLQRIAKLRRELESIQCLLPDNFRIKVYRRCVYPRHKTDLHGLICWRVGRVRHTTEEHALKSAVRIARQKIAKMKRGG